MKLHKSITMKRLLAAVEASQTDLENPGFCIRCGYKQDGCEPDAEKYNCEDCGHDTVYGAEQIMICSCF